MIHDLTGSRVRGTGVSGVRPHAPFYRRPTVRWSVRAAFLAMLVPLVASAQTSSMTPAERLVEQERVRAAVSEALSYYYQATPDGNVKNDNMVTAVGMLEEIGPAAVPLLRNELQQALVYNHAFVAYALGRIGGPEAEAALREAVADVSQLDGEFATTRRAWACWALAMQGHLDALDLFNNPPQLAAGFPIHMNTSVLEAAAMMLGADSVPVLHEQLDRYTRLAGTEDDVVAWQEEGQGPVANSRKETEQIHEGPPGRLVVERSLGRERVHVIRALRRLAHKESLPKLIALLNDDDQVIRREAAYALHVFETPAAIEALMGRLREEPLPNVRYASAWSLRQILPQGHTAEFLELLDEEYDVHVRGALYHLAAASGDKATFATLKRHLGHPDSRDRKELIAAMRRFDDPRATNVLRAALQDKDAYVMSRGAAGLQRRGTEKATQALLDQIDSPVWLRARSALQSLASLREPRVVPLIIARLTQELERPILNPVVREHIFALGDALIEVRYTGSIDEDLLAGIARQTDGTLKIYLADMLKQLQFVASHGNDVSALTDSIAGDDPVLRRLAIALLGELGGDSAASALAGTFGRVERDDALEILRALGNIDSEASQALLERVLTDPTFDPFPRLALREMAAYSARRLGGQRMAEALEAAVVRRRGRDAKVLLSLLLLEREAAIPVYERFEFDRFRYLKWTRGLEQETFQRLLSDLRAGRSLESYDLPPDEMRFQSPR